MYVMNSLLSHAKIYVIVRSGTVCGSGRDCDGKDTVRGDGERGEKMSLSQQVLREQSQIDS